ncbi:uncharacterized protein LOC127001472 isoform X3 [Eriocheir sinensis]|uniref:uncharacterized protein LOC127001472 isoform X3 n=1 Tax=Eriocheir sinensis TaxID=95602 RepID=UPI0021CA416C|nr:uncharacterized protein LOC127001472 isoform X3 [Eriocheir sinensis]
MAGRWDGFHGLPHGWEVRFDGRIGRYYFIDHINKKTSWEDPRLKSAPPPPPHPDTLPPEQKSQQDSQSLSHHPPPWMSPFLGGRISSVYPSFGGYNLAYMPPYALYGPVYPLQNVTQATESALSKKGIGGVQATDEAGLLEAVEHSQLAIAKISAMFPTVPESHIKELMRKYHNREAVVISALQVQKHPLATPGPYGTFTPPPMRHFIPTATALMALQSTKSSIGVTSASSSIGVTSTTTTTTTATQDKSKVTTTTGNGTSVGALVTTVPVVTSSKIDHPLHHPVHERAKGTHAFEEKRDKNRQSPMAGRQGSLERSTGSPFRGRGSVDKSAGSPRLRHGSVERSIGSPFFGRDSPLMSSRASSPHTFLDGSPRPTTHSISEFTRSLMGSPRMDYRYSPRPTPHSPKIKLRYLKGIFPKVEPTVILDVLTQCNYNVKDASEKLVLLGHDKKETVLVPPKLKDRPDGKENKATPKPSPGPPRPKNLSEKHKKKVRNELTSEYPALTPTVVTMALQSVYYDEKRARQVLANMMESDKKTQEALASTTQQKSSRSAEAKTVTLSLIGSPPLSRRDGVKPARPTLPRTRINTAWTAAQTVSRGTNTEEDLGFRSEQRMRPHGPNTKLHKGPSECLLLSDYQAWHGPNPENASGHCKSLAQGPRSNHLRGPSGLARGQDPSMRKGPQGLAKGPQFTQGIKKEPCFSTKVL